MKRFISMAVCLITLVSLLCQPVLAEADKKLLSTPYDLTLKQMVKDDGNPFGGVELHFKIDKMPESTEDPDGPDYWLDFERKIGDKGEWEEFGYNPVNMFGEGNGYEAPNKYMATDTWVEDNSTKIVSYRVRMMIYDTSTVSASTPWSRIATIGIKTSAWAAPEIEKAMNYGIVPASIKGDFTQPITREEFAELAALMYEKYTGKKAAPSPDTTFTDCKNPEVLKSFKLGIVNGVGNNKFEPKSLTNREQIAAMLNRAVKVIAPGADLSTTGAPVFKDAKSIASYFVENVKFMAKNNFIKGTDGNFNPKGTCTREMAVAIAVRVYEYYKK